MKLIDQVEQVHVSLCSDESYVRLLLAVRNHQSVEGSVRTDRIMAAQRIRDAAMRAGNADLSAEKLVHIRKLLDAVLHRFGQSPRQRLAELEEKAA
jgi:hypothetical protein